MDVRRFPRARAARRSGVLVAAAVAVAAVAVAGAGPAAAGLPVDRARAARPLLDHLAARQAPDGRFGAAPGARPTAAHTAWVALAVVASGEDPATWVGRRGTSLAAALVPPNAGARPGELERAAVAAAAAGRDPRDLDGRDLVAEILAAQAPDGRIEDRVVATAWGVVALRAGGVPRGDPALRRARAALERAQRRDGGWGASLDAGPSNPVDTATAIQALAALGRPRARGPLARARRYLRAVQRPDGAFGLTAGGPADPLASAWVASAIAALGERADDPSWRRGGGPLAHLRRSLGRDGGMPPTGAAAGAPLWLTAVAALALSGRPLPTAPRADRRRWDHAPQVVARQPAPGDVVTGPLIVRYRDDPGGVGVDASRVRISVGGRDLTPVAGAGPFALQIDEARLPSGRLRVRLVLVDRAGNRREIRWEVAGPRYRDCGRCESFVNTATTLRRSPTRATLPAGHRFDRKAAAT